MRTVTIGFSSAFCLLSASVFPCICFSPIMLEAFLLGKPQLVTASFWYKKDAGSIPGQGTYKSQLVNSWISETAGWCFSLSLSLSLSLSRKKKLRKKKKKKVPPESPCIESEREWVCLLTGGFDVWWSGESWSFHRRSPQIPELKVFSFGLFSFSEEIFSFLCLRGHSPGYQYSGNSERGVWASHCLVCSLHDVIFFVVDTSLLPLFCMVYKPLSCFCCGSCNHPAARSGSGDLRI